MPDTTTRLSLPFPELTDGPDGANVPHWIEALAQSLDGAAIDDQGILSARPVSTGGSPGIKGRYYMVKGDPTPANNGILWRDNGTGWDAVGTVSPNSVGTGELQDNAVTRVKVADAAVGTAELVDGEVTTGKLAAGAVTGAKINDALKPSAGAAGAAESLRALGTAAGTAAAGNDARLSDTRTPTDNTVSTAKIQNGAVTAAKVAADVATQAELDAVAAAKQNALTNTPIAWVGLGPGYSSWAVGESVVQALDPGNGEMIVGFPGGGFPTACLGVVAINGDHSALPGYFVEVRVWDQFGFVLRFVKHDGTLGAGAGPARVNYFAFGY